LTCNPAYGDLSQFLSKEYLAGDKDLTPEQTEEAVYWGETMAGSTQI
jgi:hypothetical protein